MTNVMVGILDSRFAYIDSKTFIKDLFCSFEMNFRVTLSAMLTTE